MSIHLPGFPDNVRCLRVVVTVQHPGRRESVRLTLAVQHPQVPHVYAAYAHCYYGAGKIVLYCQVLFAY